MPPRGAQFRASAQILLHHTDLAENAFAGPAHGGYDIPPKYRGLDASLVEELSRVRTDLDALEPRVIDLLVAQGYFLTDFMAKLTMPDLVFTDNGPRAWYQPGLEPGWEPAYGAVQSANANRVAVEAELEAASKRRLLMGRVPTAARRWRYRSNLALVGALTFAIVGPIAGWLIYGAWRVAMFAVGALSQVLR